ncbi:MAG: TonB family protein [Tahibacter sp.]
MAARIDNFNFRSSRGNAAPKIAAAVVALILLGAGGWYFFLRAPAEPGIAEQAATAVTGVPGATTAAPVTTAAPAAADKLNSLSVDQLFKEARTALNEQRLVAPVNNNALEFYLKILEKEPANNGAADALRELFTFAASAAEQDINGRNIDEANRVIELLTKADPNNYTLTILRSKLDAQRKIVDREAAQAQAQADAAAKRAAEPAAPSTATTAPATAAPTSATPVADATGTSAAGTAAAARTTPAPAVDTPPAAPVAAAPAASAGAGSHDAELVKQIAPQYPQAALRRRQEGWVQVEFTVTVTGDVANAHVLDSDPPRTFDRAALDAVQRWNFKPAMRNGAPTDATVRRRIEFKM